MGKGEIAHYEQFLLFPMCFQKACFPGASKGVIVLEWVKLFHSVLAKNWIKRKLNVIQINKGSDNANQLWYMFLYKSNCLCVLLVIQWCLVGISERICRRQICISDDKFAVTQHIKFVFRSVETLWEKEILRTKSVTKKEMNKCMAEIYDPGRIRTRAARFISQYHNHWAKENSP